MSDHRTNGPYSSSPAAAPRAAGQSGLTIIEVLVGMVLMVIVAGIISLLIGDAVQSKMISVARAGDVGAARKSLDWMAERLRNAGLNVSPSAQPQTRCQDRVVALDPVLLPTAHSVYVSGDMLNTTTSPPYPNATIGYYLGADPASGLQVIMEYNQACSTGATSLASYSNPLSSPQTQVTGLSFQYFDTNGNTVSNLSSAATIRQIQAINITLTVQTSQGRSGSQAETLTRYVTFRNPNPQTNTWVDVNENY